MPMAPMQFFRTGGAAPHLLPSRSQEAGPSPPKNHYFDLALGHFILDE